MTKTNVAGVELPVCEINVGVLPKKGHPVELRAHEQDRERVARACGVEGFDILEADLVATRWRRDGVELKGEIRAVVRQSCVVSLAPLETKLLEPVAMTFLPEGSRMARRDDASNGELVLDPDGPDLPETFAGETIDLWPVVVESLLLAIDPFPRAPGAVLDTGMVDAEADEDERQSPFAALKDFDPGGGNS